jgi:hypothetical protein
MEDGTGIICYMDKPHRLGSWFTFGDRFATLKPDRDSTTRPERIASTRTPTSNYAMHVSGTYQTFAGFGFFLDLNSKAYDASAYTGIRFWAKGTGSLLVTGQMASTEYKGFGGTCTLGDGVCAGNSYEVGQLSSTTWIEYKAPFALMTGGTVSPFDPKAIWSLEFQYRAAATNVTPIPFDIWIDDVYFY